MKLALYNYMNLNRLYFNTSFQIYERFIGINKDDVDWQKYGYIERHIDKAIIL